MEREFLSKQVNKIVVNVKTFNHSFNYMYYIYFSKILHVFEHADLLLIRSGF